MLICIRYPVNKEEEMPANLPQKLADPATVPRTDVGKTSPVYKLSVDHII